ncbi:MAG: DNA polymerase, partial [bacterium]
MAAAANLPRSLEGCSRAVGVGFQENLKDRAVLMRITNANKTPVPTDADIEWLSDRCVQDVLMEEQTLMRLPQWPQSAPWVNMPIIDRKINDRGVLLDVELTKGLARAAALETVRLDAEMLDLTHGQVGATTQVEALKTWLLAKGIPVPRKDVPKAVEDTTEDDETEAADEKDSGYRLRKNDIANLLALAGIPEDAKRALQIRAEAAKASVRKLRAMLRYAGPDGRLRDALVLMGAQATWRWSSTGWQGHNMVRDVVANKDEVADANKLDPKKDKHEIERLAELSLQTAIEVGRTGDPDLIRMFFGDVLPFCARMSRRTLSAPKGKVMLNGDYSSIEARIPVWLAGQQNIVQAFADGQDIYRLDAAPVYNKAPEALTKQERQVGKVMRLFLGFAGGVGAFIPAAMNYGMSIPADQAGKIVQTFRQENTFTV